MDQLIFRRPQEISRAAACITIENLKGWHAYVTNYCIEKGILHILEDPTRIGNFDETYFPHFGTNLKAVGDKNGAHYKHPGPGGQTKSSTSVGFTIFADGHHVKPLIINKGKRSRIKDCPANVVITQTPSGYMTQDSFEFYITNVLYPGK